MESADRFCGHCGKSAGGPAAPHPAYGPRRPLSRDMANKKIAGVCAGFARHLGWDVTLVRIAFLAALVIHGIGMIAYLIAWICMPRDDIRTFPAQTSV
ncbi:MAG: PspC domain-containing protein [Acidobacteria bacterium]|nr:PspC domain-containing protein [Acidobacteriota bacterium]